MPDQNPKCEECGCEGPLYFHSRCHPQAPTWAVLHGKDKLMIICAVCDKPIATMDVANMEAYHGQIH